MSSTIGSVTYSHLPSMKTGKKDELICKVAGHWVLRSLIKFDPVKCDRYLHQPTPPEHVVYLGQLPVDGRTLVYNPATDIYLPD